MRRWGGSPVRVGTRAAITDVLLAKRRRRRRRMLGVPQAALGSSALSLLRRLDPFENTGLVIDFTQNEVLVANAGEGVEPAFGAIDDYLTYSAPSPKMVLHSDGEYKYAPHNLFLNSSAPVTQTVTVVSGVKYKVKVTGSGSLTLSDAATGSVTEAGGVATFTAATTSLTCTVVGSLSTVQVCRNPSVDKYVQTAGSAKFDIPIHYDKDGNCLGALHEPAATNLFPYANDPASGKTLSGITLSSTTGPTGLEDALLLTGSGAGAITRNFNVTISLSTGTLYIVSCWVKKGTLNNVACRMGGTVFGTENRAHFDLDALTFNTPNGSFDRLWYEEYPNGWVRVFWAKTTVASAATSVVFYAAPDSTTVGSDTDGQALMSIYGIQCEATHPTSFIDTTHTSGSVTRAQDDITIPLSAFPCALDDGLSVRSDFYAPQHFSGSDYVFRISGTGASTNLVAHYLNSTGKAAHLVYDEGSATSVIGTTTDPDFYDRMVVASRFDTGNHAFSYNGETVQTNTGQMPADPITSVSVSINGNASLNAPIKSLTFLPRLITDAETEIWSVAA